MSYFSFVYKGSSRDLRKIITAILKSGIADDVKRINYVQNYILNDGKNVKKTEEKILLIGSKDGDKLNDFLSKNFSQVVRININ